MIKKGFRYKVIVNEKYAHPDPDMNKGRSITRFVIKDAITNGDDIPAGVPKEVSYEVTVPEYVDVHTGDTITILDFDRLQVYFHKKSGKLFNQILAQVVVMATEIPNQEVVNPFA